MGTRQLSRRNVTGSSSSSIGMSNVYDIGGGGEEERKPGSLRPIVIDGSNVAMAHGEATGIAYSEFFPGCRVICNFLHPSLTFIFW